mmetsp:Transcript_13954/g.43936  ORF Transcript_13954/g.43936 Transcript_13954/m.43936 type:complete len:234 (+) Transcript_13954:3046-3747(+)
MLGLLLLQLGKFRLQLGLLSLGRSKALLRLLLVGGKRVVLQRKVLQLPHNAVAAGGLKVSLELLVLFGFDGLLLVPLRLGVDALLLLKGKDNVLLGSLLAGQCLLVAGGKLGRAGHRFDERGVLLGRLGRDGLNVALEDEEVARVRHHVDGLKASRVLFGRNLVVVHKVFGGPRRGDGAAEAERANVRINVLKVKLHAGRVTGALGANEVLERGATKGGRMNAEDKGQAVHCV